MSIFERLEYIIKQKNTTIRAVEREAGVANGIIKRWEKSSPQCDKLLLVANCLNVSIEWLITGKEQEGLTDKELELIEAYRIAVPGIQDAVDKLLDVKSEQERLSNSRTG